MSPFKQFQWQHKQNLLTNIQKIVHKKLEDFINENTTHSILHDKICRFYLMTKSANFCMTDDRFLLADCTGT